jgi:hypothetical protein
MFAKYLMQLYPANLQRNGNVPAEQNHSSIRQRLGPEFLCNATTADPCSTTTARRHIWRAGPIFEGTPTDFIGRRYEIKNRTRKVALLGLT